MVKRKTRKKKKKEIETKTEETKKENIVTEQDIMNVIYKMQNPQNNLPAPIQTPGAIQRPVYNPPPADPGPAAPQPIETQNPAQRPTQRPGSPPPQQYPQQYPPQPYSPQPIQKLTPGQEKRIIAGEMIKLHKNIMILSLMFFLIPFIAVFTAFIDPIIAMIIILFGILYPALCFARSVKMHDYLSNKYHFKPFMTNRRQPQRRQRGIDLF